MDIPVHARDTFVARLWTFTFTPADKMSAKRAEANFGAMQSHPDGFSVTSSA